ncbi:MAG: hypothetical protein AAGU75_00025 [Bacillota bacterium]
MFKKIWDSFVAVVSAIWGFIQRPIVYVSIALICAVSLIFHVTLIEDYLVGLVTEIIGILITILFVQLMFDRKSKEDRQQKECTMILNHHRVMSILMSRYVAAFFCVTTSIDERINNNMHMKPKFKIKDMSTMFYPSYLSRASFSESAIEGFFEAELSLRNYMMSMVSEMDFEFFPFISDILLNFIETSISHDVRSSILDVKNTKVGEERGIDYYSKLMSEHCDEFYEKYKSGNSSGNIMIPIVNLYDMMNTERDIIIQYTEAITNMEHSQGQKMH